MTDEELLIRAQNKCEELRLALLEIGECVKAARTPIDEGELDFVTVRGELTDMDYYLMQARFAAGAMRDSVVDLVGLVQRLQTAYHVVYQAWQTAQTTLQNPDTQRVQHLIADLDQEALDLLQWVSTALSQPPEVEGVALREVLRSYQRNDG
jgi:hypothetical protein